MRRFTEELRAEGEDEILFVDEDAEEIEDLEDYELEDLED
jgi:hypothetical protein